MDEIESKIIWKGPEFISVHARMVEDTDSTPDDADCYDDITKEAWSNDGWRYVGVIVELEVLGVTFGEDSLWGIEHGTLPYDRGDDDENDTYEVEANAFEWVANETYTNEDNLTVHVMGSPLQGTAMAAADAAEEKLRLIGARGAVLDELEAFRRVESI